MLVTVVIPHETYGFGRRDPIVFEFHDEAEEYVETCKKAHEMDGTLLSYDVVICEVRSIRRQRETRKRMSEILRARRAKDAHDTGTDSSPV